MSDKPSSFASLIGDFSPVVRIFLFVGFVVALVGVASGISLQNRTLMIGIAIFLGAIAGHYWPETTYAPIYTNDEKSGGIRWGNLFLAVMFSIACFAACWFAYHAK